MVYIPRGSQAKSSDRHRCTQPKYSCVHQLLASFYLFLYLFFSFFNKLLLFIFFLTLFFKSKRHFSKVWKRSFEGVVRTSTRLFSEVSKRNKGETNILVFLFLTCGEVAKNLVTNKKLKVMSYLKVYRIPN